jgi:hypothetical protein
LLLVNGVYPLKRKSDGARFGYSVVTTSVGSGKSSRFTIFNKVWNKCGEIRENDLIRCLGYSRDGQWFQMTGYKNMSEGEIE